MRLRSFMDGIAPQFERGGRFAALYPVYEAIDTALYTPGDVTAGAPHVRDGLDLKRIMMTVWACAWIPALVGCYFIGSQALTAMQAVETAGLQGWHGFFFELFAGYDPASAWSCLIYGLVHFLPLYIVVFAAGIAFEILFAAKRGHEVNEGFFVTSILFTLTLPPTTPLWLAALGIVFGVVIGKEVFGGTGKNFLNPALTGRAFLYFAYPASQSGDAVWVPVDGYTGATALSVAADGGVPALTAAGIEWSDAFFGAFEGSLGEVSTAACLIGAAFLLYTRIASWRIMLGMLLGLVATCWWFNFLAGPDDLYMAVPWYWHAVLGGYAFGLVFMATDPVSASMTRNGKLIYGAVIGFMVALIRVLNPAYPEGVMLAILFGNMVAPLIDHAVVRANIRRRRKRSVVA